MRDELIAAGQRLQARIARDQVILELRAAGKSLREIAAHPRVRLSHFGVWKILSGHRAPYTVIASRANEE